MIRGALPDDLPAVLAIYNDAVLTSTAIWNWTASISPTVRPGTTARMALGYPVLVAESEGRVAGYGSFGDWRAFDGYRHTVEHSVYVSAERRGEGHGRALLLALIAAARGSTSM